MHEVHENLQFLFMEDCSGNKQGRHIDIDSLLRGSNTRLESLEWLYRFKR